MIITNNYKFSSYFNDLFIHTSLYVNEVIDILIKLKTYQLLNKTNTKIISWLVVDHWFYDLFLPMFAMTQNGQR